MLFCEVGNILKDNILLLPCGRLLIDTDTDALIIMDRETFHFQAEAQVSIQQEEDQTPSSSFRAWLQCVFINNYEQKIVT